MSKMTLFLGDCLEEMKRIPDGSIDLIITDPPYGISYKSNRQGLDRVRSIAAGRDVKTTKKRQYFSEISNDGKLPTEWLRESFRVLKRNSALYVFCHWSMWSELDSAIVSAGFRVKNMLVMNKSNHGMGDLKGDYAPKHELVAFCTKGRHLLNMVDGRPKNVLDVPIRFTGSRRLHPNEKPTSWYSPFILESSIVGETVLDPFMGSGTAGVACKNLNRNFIGIELDETYFNIAKDRIENA